MSPREYPERPIVGVGGVIINDGRVVLIRRRFEPLAAFRNLAVALLWLRFRAVPATRIDALGAKGTPGTRH